jgi:signal transduction histidine kinase
LNDLEILTSLDFAAFERSEDGRFTLAGDPPPCFERILPIGQAQPSASDLDEACPFLSSFLPDAERIWATGEGRIYSGPWVQRDLSGNLCALEAWAIARSGRSYLLLKMMGAEYEEKQKVFQRVRETSLANEKLGLLNLDLAAAGERLKAQNREMERLNHLKSEFLASMSHELRTPLNAIIGFTTLLSEQRAGSLNPEQREFTEHVKRASAHLLSLINDVLDLSKMEAGFLQLQREPVDPRVTVQETIATVWPLAEGKGIAVTSQLAETPEVYADPVRLKQILYNLLSNAVKFTPSGGRVTVDLSNDGAEILFTVCDTGIGIPAQEQDAVFRKFHQVDARGNREGTGLGLAISKRLVEHHGGRIWLESEPRKGSRFCFTIPCSAPGQTAPPAGSGLQA